MAINYYKTVLGIAAQLFGMILLVGIGKSILDNFYLNMDEGLSISELGVLLIVSIVLLVLTDKVPALIAGIVSGGGVGSQGIGSLGQGPQWGLPVWPCWCCNRRGLSLQELHKWPVGPKR